MTPGLASNIVEFRQYTLHRRRRDELITLFEREFVESQDAVGARVLGLFRDLDDAQRFVWLRGFASMSSRHDALTSFYEGPVWQAHGRAANATMRDAGNVLLLRPSGEQARDATGIEPGAFLALIHDLRGARTNEFAKLFDDVGRPMIAATGGTVTSAFVSEPAPNTFERLPVRSDERVHVCFVRFGDVAALDAGMREIGQANALRDASPDALLPAFMRKPEMVRLQPTARSRWR